jgi:hypothetical protein
VLRLGIQVITAKELEHAARRGRRLHGLFVGWVHLSRRVSPELRDRALGRVVVVGPRTGFRR